MWFAALAGHARSHVDGLAAGWLGLFRHLHTIQPYGTAPTHRQSTSSIDTDVVTDTYTPPGYEIDRAEAGGAVWSDHADENHRVVV